MTTFEATVVEVLGISEEEAIQLLDKANSNANVDDETPQGETDQ